MHSQCEYKSGILSNAYQKYIRRKSKCKEISVLGISPKIIQVIYIMRPINRNGVTRLRIPGPLKSTRPSGVLSWEHKFRDRRPCQHLCAQQMSLSLRFKFNYPIGTPSAIIAKIHHFLFLLR